MNTHINYNDGAYADLGRVENDLSYLGIKRIRTAAGGGVVPTYAYLNLARQGVKFDFVVLGSDQIDSGISLADTVASDTPGSVDAFEGFNEINNWPISYNGKSGTPAAVDAQSYLYQKVRASTALNGTPVIFFTGGPQTDSVQGLADLANVHAYTHNAQEPEKWIVENLKQFTGAAGSAPAVNTEFGNFSLPTTWPKDKPYWEAYVYLGVDEVTQAKIILQEFFEGARMGLKRSYVYELLDEKIDSDGSQPEFHYGLFNFDHTPKLSATALHNLTKIMTQGEGSTRLARMGYALTVNSADVRSLEVTRNDGSLALIVWSVAQFWEWTSDWSRALKPASQPVTLTLTDSGSGSASNVISAFNPLAGETATQTVSGPTMTVDLADGPKILILSRRP